MITPKNINHTIFKLRRLSDGASVFVFICFITGLIMGGAAYGLKQLMSLASGFADHGLTVEPIQLHRILFPAAGIILAGCFQKYILHMNIDHGTDRINHALRNGQTVFPPSLMFSPVIGSALTLGFGGSAGAEGPIAYAGAAIGSHLGRFVKVSDEHLSMLVTIGAGAGIAGLFQAPVGGVFFAVEILSASFSALAIVGLATGCVTSALTVYLLSGDSASIAFANVPAFAPSMILWALPVGILCGMYAFYYTSVMTRMTEWLENVRHDWVKWIIAGAGLSLAVFLFPALYGDGYGSIAGILAGHGEDALCPDSVFGMFGKIPRLPGIMLLALSIAAVKVIASAFTNSGGGVAGDFAPTIFSGAVWGYLLAVVATGIFGFDVSVTTMVLVSMGAVMSGCVGAPLMAMFTVAEMTGGYGLFIPLAIASVTSYLVVRGLRAMPVPGKP